MKRNTLRVLALFLSVLTGLAVFSFAVAAEDPDAFENVTGEVPDIATGESDVTDDSFVTSPNKSDYYTRIADMNEDWVLNTADARNILRLAVGLDWAREPDWLPKGCVFGDIDDNGVVNTSDARAALRVGVKLNTVDEVIEMAANRPKPSVPSTEPTETTEPTKPSDPATTEPVKNPDKVDGLICEPFALEMKSVSGASYVIASDGRNCFVRVPELLSGLGVYVDEEGVVYLVDNEGEYAAFTGDLLKKLGVTPASVRAFAAAYSVPEFGYFDGFEVSEEVIDNIGFTVAEKDGVAFYFYPDGSFLKVVGDNWEDKEITYTTISVPEDLTVYTDLSKLGSEISTNLFILKHGADILF